MNIAVFIIVLFALQLICLIVGHRASKKLSTQEDYFLAGKGIRFFPLMMTLVATQIGGGLVLGSAEEAYRYGWYVILYPLGACLGLMLLAAGIGKRMAAFKVSTVAQLFEVVYSSSALKKVASCLSMISLFMILIAQVIASKKFMVSLGVSNELIFAAFWTIVIVYTVAGGLKAVVATDIIQAAFFITVFLACFGYSWFVDYSSVANVIHNDLGQGFEFDQAKLTGWLLMPLFFMVIEQDMGQRCFAAKSGKTVSWACGVAAVCTIVVCLVPVFYGILGKILNIPIVEGSSVLMTVIQHSTTPVLTALVGCAILAAIISTADSLINAISSNLAQDFNLALFSRSDVKSSQWLTASIAVGAFLLSFAFNNVVDLLIMSYELSVSCLFVPVFAALFIKKGNVQSATYAVALGAAGFVLFNKLPGIPYIPKELASLAMSLMGYLVGERRARATLQSKVIS